MTIHLSIAKVNDFCAENKTHFTTHQLKRFTDLAEIITRSAWSPIIWKGGQRREKYYDGCSLLVLDYDVGVPTVKSMIETMRREGYRYMIGTTKSHQVEKVTKTTYKPACDRFRLILQTDRPFAAHPLQFKGQMEKIQKKWPIADQSCKDQARFFFPCRKIASCEDGRLFKLPKPEKVESIKRKIERSVERQMAQAKLGKLPARVDSFLNDGVSSARREDIFFSAATLSRLGWHLKDAERAILAAPFDRTGLSDKDIEDLPRQIQNGYKAGRCQV